MHGRCGLAALLLLGGCATTAATPEVITVEAGGYERAFDAAVEAGRRLGLPPALEDRRHGVIETAPAEVASLLEPWRIGTTPLATTLESTVALQRRRARFEFAPSGEAEDPAGSDDGARGPDLLAAGPPPADLTGHEGPLELRVLVFLERAHQPGLRRDTWSRQHSDQTTIVRGLDDPPERSFWTPIGRDLAFEARLRGLLRAALR